MSPPIVARAPYIGTWVNDDNGPQQMAAVFGPLGYSAFTCDWWPAPALFCRVWALTHGYGWLSVRPVDKAG